MLVLARSSGADSTTTTKVLPLPAAAAAAVLATVPSRRVRAGSIGSALNAAKLVAALALVCGEKGEEGEAVLVSRRERRVAADGVRASGGGLRFVGGCVEGGGRSAVAAAGLLVLRGAAGVGELASGWLGNALARGESGLGLVGEAEKLGPAVNLLLWVGETRGPLGDGGRSMLLRRE